MAVVLPAAGQARRFGSGENKIWASLNGRPVLAWTLDAFQRHPGVDSITLVGGEADLPRLREASAAFPKVKSVVLGGTTRAESVKCGLDAIPEGSDLVLVHDAARPLVSAGVIDRVIEATARVGASVPGLPLSDTVKRTDASGIVRSTIPRNLTLDGETLSGLTAVQTPQGARVSLLHRAYSQYDYSKGEPTDEASLIEALGEPVQIVAGDPTNLKITRPDDIALAEKLSYTQSTPPISVSNGDGEALAGKFASSSSPAVKDNGIGHNGDEINMREFRTGFGYDVHAFASPEAGRKLFLGGVEIPHDRGLEGHSDADVLLHAVCDALLGAASLGDIGILFPNTDMTYKGISSLKLLEIVSQRLAEAGWQVVNIDATVVAEAPKLMPHRLAIQESMARCLEIESERISVKATTAEKMGFIGRREGMEASAIATIVRR